MLSLVDVTRSNYIDVIELCVSPEQEAFVGTPAEGIADVHFDTTLTMRAVCRNDDNVLVGLLVYRVHNNEHGGALLSRFLIGSQFQGHGYGTMAFRLLLHELHAAGRTYLMLRVHRHAVEARALYEKFSMRLTPDNDDHLLGILLLSRSGNA